MFKQRTTWLGITAIVSAILGLFSGTMPYELAYAAIANGAGLVFARE